MITAGEVLLFFGCIYIILALFTLNGLTAFLGGARAELPSADVEANER